MAVRPYSEFEESSGYEETSGSGIAGKVFLWLAWALAAAFWAFSLTTGVGILEALRNPAGGPGPGEADAGGVGWLLINFIGVVILGCAIAYGVYRYSTRDRRTDPITEAATHAEYDMVEAAGGDDAVTRSPEAHRPEERDAARVVGASKRPRKP